MNLSMKKIAIVMVPTLLSLSSFSAVSKTATFTASVEVKNTFELEVVEPLSFGKIRATADTVSTSQASLTMPANPSATIAPPLTTTEAAISVLEDGSPAKFTIDGVAAFTELTITDPTDTDITPKDAAPSGTAMFKLDSFTYFVVEGANPGTDVSAGKIQVDAEGKATFTLGATLSTDPSTPTSDYLDGMYEGTFTLEVAY
jgi:cell wall-associated NlpC family hydrolase